MLQPLTQKISVLLAPASQTNSATRTANLDTLGADYATIIMNYASAINTNAVGPTISLKESDDTTASNFATFNSNYALAAHSIAASHQTVFHIDCKGRKRYLRLTETTDTTTNDNVTMGATAILSRVAALSAAASSMLGSTNDVVVVG